VVSVDSGSLYRWTQSSGLVLASRQQPVVGHRVRFVTRSSSLVIVISPTGKAQVMWQML